MRALLPVAAAIALGFSEFSEKVFASLQRVPPENRWKEVVRWYSPQHCDHPDSSCPVVTLAPEIARTKLPVRKRMAGLMYPKLDVLMNNAGIMLHKNLKVPATDPRRIDGRDEHQCGGVIRTTSAFIDILAANKGTVINVSSGLAFVPLSSAPIYCATKAAVHSYTQSLRFQLEESGVEVIELMPPAIKTALSADLPEGGLVALITTDELLKQTFAAFKKGNPLPQVGMEHGCKLPWRQNRRLDQHTPRLRADSPRGPTVFPVVFWKL